MALARRQNGLLDLGQLALLEQIRRHQLAQMPAQHLLRPPAEDPFRRPVPRPEMAVDIQRENHIGRIVHDALQLPQMPVAVAGDVGFGGQRRIEHEHLFQCRNCRVRPAGIPGAMLPDQRTELLEMPAVRQQKPARRQADSFMHLPDLAPVGEVRRIELARRDPEQILPLHLFQAGNRGRVAQQFRHGRDLEQLLIKRLHDGVRMLRHHRPQRLQQLRIVRSQTHKSQPLLTFPRSHRAVTLRRQCRKVNSRQQPVGRSGSSANRWHRIWYEIGVRRDATRPENHAPTTDRDAFKVKNHAFPTN